MSQPKTFKTEKYTDFTISAIKDRGDATTDAGARRFAVNKLTNATFAMQTSEVINSEIDRYLNVAGINTSEKKPRGNVIYDGIINANFNYDGTSNTYKAERGKDLCFDTVTGKCVTGINPGWGGDEYIIVATAMESCEKIGITKIPIKLRAPIAPKRLHTYPFKNDAGEEIPSGAVMSQKNRESVNGTSYRVMEKPNPNVFNPPWWVNVGDAVPSGETGTCCALEDDAGLCLYDTNDELPPWDEQIGPKPGSWMLHRGYIGFHVESDIEGGMVLAKQEVPHIVLAKSGSSGVPATNGTTLVLGKARVVIYTQMIEGSDEKLFPTLFIPYAFNVSLAAVKADKYLHLVRVNERLQVNFEDCAQGV